MMSQQHRITAWHVLLLLRFARISISTVLLIAFPVAEGLSAITTWKMLRKAVQGNHGEASSEPSSDSAQDKPHRAGNEPYGQPCGQCGHGYSSRGTPGQTAPPMYGQSYPQPGDSGPTNSFQPMNRYPQNSDNYPQNGDQYPSNAGQYPQSRGQYPQTGGQYPQNTGQYPSNIAQYSQSSDQYPQNGSQYPQSFGQYPQSGGQYPQSGGQYPQSSGQHLHSCVQYPQNVQSGSQYNQYNRPDGQFTQYSQGRNQFAPYGSPNGQYAGGNQGSWLGPERAQNPDRDKYGRDQYYPSSGENYYQPAPESKEAREARKKEKEERAEQEEERRKDRGDREKRREEEERRAHKDPGPIHQLVTVGVKYLSSHAKKSNKQ